MTQWRAIFENVFNLHILNVSRDIHRNTSVLRQRPPMTLLYLLSVQLLR